MLSRTLMASFTIIFTIGGLLSTYALVKSHVKARVYLERLAEVSSDYHDLQAVYSEAVRRTAVTELLVTEGGVDVVIRTIEGQLQILETPFDPKREIYVDYVVLNGRLWIRRLFDDTTAPEKGMIIDPALALINWNTEGASHGKAAYRSLSPGRWIVDVSGDGSLGLTKRDEGSPLTLALAPPVRRYDPIEVIVKDELDAISPFEAAFVLYQEFSLKP
jgi:hypothetical protein